MAVNPNEEGHAHNEELCPSCEMPYLPGDTQGEDCTSCVANKAAGIPIKRAGGY